MGQRKKGKSGKRSGHYCWACDSYRANEKFSGKGHGRHLCRDCSKLGSEELEYRQSLRNLERCVTWEGFIRRKKRKEFERYLNCSDPRIRSLALEIQAEDAISRACDRASNNLDAELADFIVEYYESESAGSDSASADSIPF